MAQLKQLAAEAGDGGSSLDRHFSVRKKKGRTERCCGRPIGICTFLSSCRVSNDVCLERIARGASLAGKILHGGTSGFDMVGTRM